jgi:uncharacterized protein (DUF885 family)
VREFLMPIGRLFVAAFAAVSSVFPASAGAQVLNRELQELGQEFFAWRAATQPCTGDDIPRVERPAGWLPDFSPGAIHAIRIRNAGFRDRLRELKQEGWSRGDSVDALLLRSAMERVEWELGVLCSPSRDPSFYIQQSLGPVYETLLLSSPWTDARAEELLLRMGNVPPALGWGRENLTAGVKPFAGIALRELEGVRTRVEQMVKAVAPLLSQKFRQPLLERGERAAAALEEYAAWLRTRTPRMAENFSVGAEAYERFLRTVALQPMTTGEMLRLGRSEFDRAVTFEQLEKKRNAELPPLPLFATAGNQIAQEKRDEESIRRFLEEKRLLTVPRSVGHYVNREIPSYLEAFSWLGVVDDLTSASRPGEDGVAYIPPPGPELSYFRKACAQDPRPIVIHEGIPGHYFQLVMSWMNPDPIRRHYFDSGPNEGWGFYVEEMLLQAGLFERDRPQGREIIYNFMRLRALRVEVDIRLATGDFTIDEAAEYLARSVPMDLETAREEAAMFAATPGQAITYQIGKLQILKLISDARRILGERFDLRAIHDQIATNGYVPIALLRWELLGLDDELKELW